MTAYIIEQITEGTTGIVLHEAHDMLTVLPIAAPIGGIAEVATDIDQYDAYQVLCPGWPRAQRINSQLYVRRRHNEEAWQTLRRYKIGTEHVLPEGEHVAQDIHSRDEQRSLLRERPYDHPDFIGTLQRVLADMRVRHPAHEEYLGLAGRLLVQGRVQPHASCTSAWRVRAAMPGMEYDVCEDTCTCSRFRRGGICRHLWAARLYALVAQQLIIQ